MRKQVATLPDWSDPIYQAAKAARADAYAEFCRIASDNPFLYGQDGYDDYYQANTVPAREEFRAAHRAWQTEVDRVKAGHR